MLLTSVYDNGIEVTHHPSAFPSSMLFELAASQNIGFISSHFKRMMSPLVKIDHLVQFRDFLAPGWHHIGRHIVLFCRV